MRTEIFVLSNCIVHKTAHVRCGPKCFALICSVLYETVYVPVLTEIFRLSNYIVQENCTCKIWTKTVLLCLTVYCMKLYMFQWAEIFCFV